MERQGKGAIVNIASVSGIRWLAVPHISYATTKAAVIQFTRVIALEYPRKGIRANSIPPWMMNTPMLHAPGVIAAYGASTEEMVSRRDEQCPMGRMGDAWDAACAAPFLASDEANTSPVPSWLSMAGSRSTASEHPFSDAASSPFASNSPTDGIQLDCRGRCEFRENSHRDSIWESSLNSHRRERNEWRLPRPFRPAFIPLS
jgi:hypothetical protein